jgi:PAS domain S-box-containing protein
MANNEINFPDKKFIVSKTDLKGVINYGNALFIEMSGYSEKDLLGKPHNILRHPDMPKLIFKLLWEHISSGREIFAYVKNRTKENDYYWVFAHVTPSIDKNGKIIGYHSVRRKPKADSLEKIISLYKSLFNAEQSGGVKASQELLNLQLSKTGLSYAEFILTY